MNWSFDSVTHGPQNNCPTTGLDTLSLLKWWKFIYSIFWLYLIYNSELMLKLEVAKINFSLPAFSHLSHIFFFLCVQTSTTVFPQEVTVWNCALLSSFEPWFARGSQVSLLLIAIQISYSVNTAVCVCMRVCLVDHTHTASATLACSRLSSGNAGICREPNCPSVCGKWLLRMCLLMSSLGQGQ